MDLNLANDSTCSEFLATDLYIALKCSDEFRVYSISPDNYLQLQHETTNQVNAVVGTLDSGISFIESRIWLHHLDSSLLHFRQRALSLQNYFISDSISVLQNENKTYLKVLLNNEKTLKKIVLPAGRAFEFAIQKEPQPQVACCTKEGITQCQFYQLQTEQPYQILQKYWVEIEGSTCVEQLQQVNTYLVMQCGQLLKVFKQDETTFGLQDVFQTIVTDWQQNPRVSVQQNHFGATVYLLRQRQTQQMQWTVADSLTFIGQQGSLLQTQNRIVYDRHQADHIFGYADEHSLLHPGDQQTDLVALTSAPRKLFLVGRCATGLCLQKISQCSLNEEPVSCEKLPFREFMNLEAWLSGSQSVQDCKETPTLSGFQLANHNVVCQPMISQGQIKDLLKLPIVPEPSECQPGFAKADGVCQKCTTGCQYCMQQDKCEQCKQNFSLQDDGSCACSSGLYLHLNRICLPCKQTNCELCSSDECFKCETGFEFSIDLLSCEQIACPQGSYLRGNTCEQCQQGCLQCDQCQDKTCCSECRQGFELTQKGQCIECSENQYQTASGKCKDCDTKCERCSGAQECQQCKPGFALKDGICQTCQPGTFLRSETCHACSAHCLDCESNDQCLECEEGFKPSSEGHCEKCPIGTYLYNQECYPCMEGCDICTADKNQCTQCSIDYKKQQNPFSDASRCLKIICGGENEFLNGGLCQQCQEGCLKCTALDQCTKCDSGFQLDAGMCTACNKNQFYDFEEEVCADCPPRCTSCQEFSQCLKCMSDSLLVDGKCETCPDGSYIEPLLETLPYCESCPSNCETCTSSSECETCKHGFALQEQMCNRCPDGKYDFDSECFQCSQGCELCSSIAECYSCEPGYNLVNGACSKIECASNEYFLSERNECISCPSGCSECLSHSLCTACAVSFTLTSTNECGCTVGQFLTIDGQCQNCQSNCLECASADQCLTCLDNFENDLEEQVCKPCQESQYFEFGMCLDCESRCARCTGANECVQCLQGFAIEQGECVVCSHGSYLQNSNCYPCQQGCRECSSFETCDSCQPGYFLTQNTTESQGLCEPCALGCAKCSSSDQCDICQHGYELATVLEQQNKCQLKNCLSNQYVSVSDQLCHDCPKNCQKCTEELDSGSNLICEVCEYGFYEFQHLCIQCPIGCSKCIIQRQDDGSLRPQCLECQPGRFFMPDSDLCQSCEIHQFVDIQEETGILSCRNCSQSIEQCMTCEDKRTCTSCKQGFLMAVSGLCLSQCAVDPASCDAFDKSISFTTNTTNLKQARSATYDSTDSLTTVVLGLVVATSILIILFCAILSFCVVKELVPKQRRRVRREANKQAVLDLESTLQHRNGLQDKLDVQPTEARILSTRNDNQILKPQPVGGDSVQSNEQIFVPGSQSLTTQIDRKSGSTNNTELRARKSTGLEAGNNDRLQKTKLARTHRNKVQDRNQVQLTTGLTSQVSSNSEKVDQMRIHPEIHVQGLSINSPELRQVEDPVAQMKETKSNFLMLPISVKKKADKIAQSSIPSIDDVNSEQFDSSSFDVSKKEEINPAIIEVESQVDLDSSEQQEQPPHKDDSSQNQEKPCSYTSISEADSNSQSQQNDVDFYPNRKEVSNGFDMSLSASSFMYQNKNSLQNKLHALQSLQNGDPKTKAAHEK